MSDDDLKAQWIEQCLDLAGRPSKLWEGGQRKILRNQRVTFYPDESLTLADLGYQEKKGNDLKGYYLHHESRNHALEHWRQRQRGKMKSVCFHTFAHYEKAAGKSDDGAVQGPCMLSVTVTQTSTGDVSANIAYRSTEFFKKFPADLTFIRDVLLDEFAVNNGVTFHIANMTLHPLYFPHLYPFLDNPVQALCDVQKRDERFWRAIVKESKDLLCDGRRNANFAQGQRVKKHVLKALDPDVLEHLQTYLRPIAV